MSDLDNKERVEVSPFDVIVLGGRFQVKEVIVQSGVSQDKLLATIKATPPERWFVLLAGEGGSTWDILSMIDDDFDFVMYAVGVFTGE